MMMYGKDIEEYTNCVYALADELTKEFDLRIAMARIRSNQLDLAPDMYAVLSCIVGNAKIGPDVAMADATDCYHVPLDDIDAAHEILKRICTPMVSSSWAAKRDND
jgi:hypothetical protein